LLPRIQAALRQADVGLHSLQVIAPSLEDVFISSVRAPGPEEPALRTGP
jgi:hypothetical protein